MLTSYTILPPPLPQRSGLGMPTEYLDRATAISVGQHWRASELLAALGGMRYERAAANKSPERGEYTWSRWSGLAADDVDVHGGGTTGHTLSVHLVHEERVLDVRFAPVGQGGQGGEDDDQVGKYEYGARGDGDMEMVVRELSYRDAGSGGQGFAAPAQAGADASLRAEAGAEALLQAVLEAGEAEEMQPGEPLLPILSKADVKALRVADLRVACAERALDTSGLKPVLAARLAAHEEQRRAGSGGGGGSPRGSAATSAATSVATRAATVAAAGTHAVCENEAAAGEKDESSPAHVVLYPASHYTAGQEEQRERVLRDIAAECATRVEELLANGQEMEAERLRYRTESDLVDIAREGYCRGMENYSRHLTGRQPGEAPPTLLDYSEWRAPKVLP